MESTTDNKFRRIGQGFCGTVWAPTGSGTGCVIKREDGGPGRSLYNDYIVHQNVSKSLSTGQFRVHVPTCHQYVVGDDCTWWDERISRFPSDFQVPCNALISDRIPPFPEAVRNTIIDRYCSESLRPSIKLSEPDQDCLIRPYLGRRRRLVKHSRLQAFSLRNYPLHMDQIEELALDGRLYARIMAEALADLYWRAQVDANDVEFVLAPLKKDYVIEAKQRFDYLTTIKSDILGEHVVWILDFDCCKRMTLDEKGVEQAVWAFYRNDPFYPRPGRNDLRDHTLWNEFKGRFLAASEAILGREGPEARLPELWVTLVEQRSQL